MWLTEDQINKAKNVISTYGEDTVAGQFAKEILELSTSSSLFGEYSVPLTVDEAPCFTHKLDSRWKKSNEEN